MSETCTNCGAEMTWNPGSHALVCAYCESSVEIERGEGTILERPLSAADEVERGLGIETRTLACDNCGASVAFGEELTADRCVYCGSPSVLAQESNRNAIRPESLVPLEVGREAVESRLTTWRKGLWFRPGALKKVDRFEAVGIYVPFWTFDCRARSHWWAESGTYYWVTETYWTMENGRRVQRTRQVRKTRWSPSSGAREDLYDDLLVCGSRGLSPDLLRRLGEFDTTALVPYDPGYLAGFRAEEYQLDLGSSWDQAQQTVAATQRGRCAADVPGDTHRNLEVQNRVTEVRWKHVLLPVWTVTYRFRKKPYLVLIHGQSGEVVGEAPYSMWKILFLVLAVVCAVGGLVLAVTVS